MADHYTALLGALGVTTPPAAQSPERTGVWQCPGCANTTAFVGYWPHPKNGRTCWQPVTVAPRIERKYPSDGCEYGEQCYLGTGEPLPDECAPADYPEIRCGRCLAAVWAEGGR